MIARAKEAPFAALVVLWLRFLDVALTAYDSARVDPRGDYCAFRAVLFIALQLFATTGAHHYLYTFLSSNRL